MDAVGWIPSSLHVILSIFCALTYFNRIEAKYIGGEAPIIVWSNQACTWKCRDDCLIKDTYACLSGDCEDTSYNRNGF